MENVNKKGKLRGKKFVWFERMLRREGRKLCAVALCASMIIGNMAWPAAAANDTSGEYSFELSSESLFIAIQDAIAEGTVVDTELDLKGSAAEEYQELLEAGGNLYEIEPVIDNTDTDRDKVLDLRAFVRLENDIELDSAYVMDGAEEVTFLLVNSSDVYQQATISVDGRESETITVLPAGAVAVDEEEAGPGVTGTVTNSYTNVTGSISKSSSGSGGGGSNDISTDVEDNTQTNGTETINTNTDNAENVDIVIENEEIGDSNDETGSIIEVQIEANTDNYAQDPEENKSSTEEQQEITDLYGTDNNTTGTQNEMGDTQGENEEDSNLETDSDPIDNNTTSNGEAANGDIADGESEDSADQTSGPEDSDVTDDSGSEAAEDDVESGTDESGNNNTTDEQDSDTGTGDETDDEDEEVGSDKTYASAISVHTTYLLAATATYSDAEEATPSDAYGLNGQTYETVLVSGEAAVAYVTEASELGLDQIESITYSAETDDIEVSVEAPVGAFAAGVTMEVTEADSEDFAEAVQNDLDENYPGTTYTIIDSQAITISFYDQDGNEVEPSEDVEVTISNLSLSTENKDGVEAEYALIYHMMDDGSVEWIEDQTPGQESYTFTASSFSSYGVANVSAEYEISTAATYSEEYTVAVGYSQTISADSFGQGGPQPNKTITNYTVTATTGSVNGVTVTENKGNGQQPGNQSIQSLTVTGVTVGTVVVITVTYSNGETGTYTITVIDPADLTVDHIDIDISTTAVVYINGVKYEVDVTLTEDDYTSENVTLTAVDANGNPVSYEWDLDNIQTSTGSSQESQLRVPGTFPIGTEDSPVTYTLTLTKDVTITTDDGTKYTITVTFTSTFSFWDDDNACPGLGDNWTDDKKWSSGAGMDFALGSGTGSRSVLTIYKYVYDTSGNLLTEADGDSYGFNVYDSTGNVVKAVTLTVNDGIGMYTTDVDTAGSYYVTETSYENTIGSYTYNETSTSSSYITDNNTNTETTNGLTTAIMTVSSDGTTIYNVYNYYGPSTASITITKKVTGNMGDTTKEFKFTLTDKNGDPVGTGSDGKALTEDGFTLSSDESEIISGLTIGDTVYLEELLDDDDKEDYTVTVTGAEKTEDGKYAITVGEGVSITVTNDKTKTVDAGIFLDTIPYVLLLSLAVIPGAFLLFRKRSQWF